MKTLTPRIALLALGAVVAISAAAQERVVPQPRVRLYPSPQGSVARLEPIERTPAAVAMAKVVVTESRLPQGPADEAPSDSKRFSLMEGGTISAGKIGDAPYAIGLWPRYDLFWKDAKFKPAKTHVDIELVRVKL